MTERRKIVFISSPYTGDTLLNTTFARDACRYAILNGYTPAAPHLIYPNLIPDNDPKWRKVGLEMCRDILSVCSELWVCGPCISAGMRAELEHAGTLVIAVRMVSSEEIYGFLSSMLHQEVSSKEEDEA